MNRDDDDTQMYVAQRQWVGLTNNEVNEIRENIFKEYEKALLITRDVNEQNDYNAWNFYKQIEAKLKERNGG
jgi:hypothetical protein